MKLNLKIILLALLLIVGLVNCSDGDEQRAPAKAKLPPAASPVTPGINTPLKKDDSPATSNNSPNKEKSDSATANSANTSKPEVNHITPSKSSDTVNQGHETGLKERTIDKAKDAAKKLEKTIPPDQDLMDQAGEAPPSGKSAESPD